MGRLIQFLYLLMRDELPTGALASILEHIEAEPEFTNQELVKLAERYARTILEG